MKIAEGLIFFWVQVGNCPSRFLLNPSMKVTVQMREFKEEEVGHANGSKYYGERIQTCMIRGRGKARARKMGLKEKKIDFLGMWNKII